jgi:uncharacterized MAPEG superfamily protein
MFVPEQAQNRAAESNMLTLSIIVAGALVWISAVGQHIGNLTSHGAKWVMSDRSHPVSDDGFPGRSARTLRNNVESCAMYVPVAFLSLVLHQSSWATGVTAGVYAAIRTIFTLCYWLKFNSLRSLSWLVGMICNAVMAALALQGAAFPPA